MAAATIDGRVDWSKTVDDAGKRTYSITWLVVTASTSDGPAVASAATGLAVAGAAWSSATNGGSNDADSGAYCNRAMTVKKYGPKKDKGNYWLVTQTFSTDDSSNCEENTDNPLLTPDRVSGGFSKYTVVATQDRAGDPLVMSNHERIRGAEAEFDNNRPTVRIEKNLATLPLTTFAPLVDSVNSTTMWGLTARKVKLSNVTWEKVFYGGCGSHYYKVSYEFDINYDTFDRIVQDRGFMVLAPGGTKTNPAHYQVYKDAFTNENTPVSMPLDGNGAVAIPPVAAAEITIEYYAEANLVTSLGLPATL